MTINRTLSACVAAFAALIFLLPSCSRSGDGKEQSAPAELPADATPVRIERLDLALDGYPSADDAARAAVRDSFADAIATLSMALGRPLGSDAAIIELARSQGVSVFEAAVKERLGSLDSVNTALTGAVARLRGAGIVDSGTVRVYGVSLPYRQSVLMSDSTVIVALNHYLGADFDGYESFPDYERRLKVKRMIAPDAVEAMVASRHPYQPSAEATALHRMLYEGALVYVKMAVTDGLTLSDAIGISGDDLDWLKANERSIREALVSKNLLYSTDSREADRLVQPSPATTLIHPDVPGRAGRWVGYELVRSYMSANPGTPLSKLLTPAFYTDPATFRAAGSFID